MTEEKLEARKAYTLDFAKTKGMTIRDLNRERNKSLKKYTKADFDTFFSNPKTYANQLSEMSESLYLISPHYRRLINYFAKMPTLDYIIEPTSLPDNPNPEDMKASYYEFAKYVEMLNLKHELVKAQVVAWTCDTFYGYIFEENESFFILRLPNTYCRVSGIIGGVFVPSFDFKFFDENKLEIENYPKEFKSMYNKYLGDTKNLRWQQLDPTKVFCIKFNEHLNYDFPPFASVIKAVFDIEDYKSLKKVEAKLGNYKLIGLKLPMRDGEVNNDFMIDLDTATQFFNLVGSVIPEEVGTFITPFETETIEFKRDNSANDDIKSSEEQFYNSAGTSQLLFNASGNSSASLGKSMKVDEEDVFALLRQIERVVNSLLNEKFKSDYKFKVRFLDVTNSNREEYIKSLIQSSQYGLPVKSMLASVYGISPSSLMPMAFLENEVLKLHETFVPLQTSHTMTSKESDGGRPQKDDTQLTDSGDKTRANEDNSKDKRG